MSMVILRGGISLQRFNGSFPRLLESTAHLTGSQFHYCSSNTSSNKHGFKISPPQQPQALPSKNELNKASAIGPATLPPSASSSATKPMNTTATNPSTAHNTAPLSPAPSKAASAYSPHQIRKNVRSYVFGQYINYIKNYDEVLEKKFPAAMKVYRVFAVGIKDFYNDMKRFLKITRIVNTSTQGLRALTRRELELYYQMPRDMLRVAPVLMLSALPFANYVIFPVAYMYPKQFLSPQFWSIQQRAQFSMEMLQHRLRHQMPVLRFMQAQLTHLRSDEEAFRQMRYVLGRLGSGQHASVADVEALTEVLSRSPYNLESLPRSVLSHLCGLHGIHRGLRKRDRLAYHTFVVHHMDLAIRREGGVHNMPLDALVRACNIRGLNTVNMSTDDMVDWLRQWVSLSVPVEGASISQFLFLPIFIAYNHPNNWKLLYEK